MQNNLDILKNKTNSQNMSSAKKNEKEEKESKEKSMLDGISKIREWQKGLQSHSGWERLQTGADIAKTIISGM